MSISYKVKVLKGSYIQFLCYVKLCLLVALYSTFGRTCCLNHVTWICSSSFLPFHNFLALHLPPEDILLSVIDWITHLKLCYYICWSPIKNLSNRKIDYHEILLEIIIILIWFFAYSNSTISEELVDYIVTGALADLVNVWIFKNYRLELRHKLGVLPLGVVSVAINSDSTSE